MTDPTFSDMWKATKSPLVASILRRMQSGKSDQFEWIFASAARSGLDVMYKILAIPDFFNFLDGYSLELRTDYGDSEGMKQFAETLQANYEKVYECPDNYYDMRVWRKK